MVIIYVALGTYEVYTFQHLLEMHQLGDTPVK